MKIWIINGPNLNLLGKREPEIYGSTSFDDYMGDLKASFVDVDLNYYQTNHEGKLIDKLHEVGFDSNGIILNPGALTHSSIAVADAIASIETKVIEVHISNIYSREEFRRKSLTAPNCLGVISGLGLGGYELALEYFLSVRK
jgi:3-dehydroquinate dehydratase-2